MGKICFHSFRLYVPRSPSELGNGTDPTVSTVQVIKQADQLFGPNHTTAYAIHVNAGMQQELSPSLTLSADYVMRRYVHMGGFQSVFSVDRNRFNRPRVIGMDPNTGVVSFVRDPVIPLCTPAQAAALNPKTNVLLGPSLSMAVMRTTAIRHCRSDWTSDSLHDCGSLAVMH